LLLHPEGEAVSVPVENLDPVAAAVGEDEQVSRERVLAEDVAGDLCQAVIALSEVDQCGGDVDTERL
jgi:hypothetical protein